MIFLVLRKTAGAVLIGFIAYAVHGQLGAPDQPERVGTETRERASAASAPQPAPLRSMTIPAGRNGHYELDAKVNGKTVRFMIDTGASAIVLNREDAKRVGLRLREHDFAGRAHTANGVVRWAPVVLRDLRLGTLTLSQVEASVNDGPLNVSLLGMSFLRRLKGYEVRNDRLVLYW
jgi:aspartyl protease family protein